MHDAESLKLKRLMSLDFMATDLALFLDTHPHDKKALETYCAIVTEAKSARAEYEKDFGPLRQEDVTGHKGWSWITEPWAWEEDANICMRGDA